MYPVGHNCLSVIYLFQCNPSTNPDTPFQKSQKNRWQRPQTPISEAEKQPQPSLAKRTKVAKIWGNLSSKTYPSEGLPG